ncbi:MAG: DNA primase, partial [Eubacterium sp.]
MDKDMDLLCQCDYKEETCAKCEHQSAFKDTEDCPKKQLKRENIRRGCSALMVLCAELELEVERLTWDKRPDGLWAGNLKGIDDFELYKRQRKTKLEQSGSE